MGRFVARSLALAARAAAPSCAPDPEVLPPRGEALVVVDTDAPVPRLAGRLRVDLYDDQGTWIDSRDVPRENAGEWPASFSVYTYDEKHGRTVIVRLRAYPEGKVRDYRGVRYAPRPTGAAADPTPLPPPAPGEAPRLVIDGVDVTPKTEPQPALAIDRLLRLHLEPASAPRARDFVTLPTGTVFDLAGNLSEWTRDRFNTQDEPCWAQQGANVFHDPVCDVTSPSQGDTRTARGGSWLLDERILRAAFRDRGDPVNAFPMVGVRCARPGT